MLKTWNEELEIESIRTDLFLQPRADEVLDPEHLERLPEDVDTDHPVHVFRVENIGNLLAGGHYRLRRVQNAGRTIIKATVHEGTWADAFLFSRGENERHGKPRTREDVRHSIIQAFVARKEKGLACILTDKAIADSVPISKSRVSELRQEWEKQFGPEQFPPRTSGKRGARSAPPSGASEESDAEGDRDDALDRGEVENDPDPGDADDDEEDAPKPAPATREEKMPPLPDLDFGAAKATAEKVLAENAHLTDARRRHHIAGYLHKCLQPALGMLEALGLLKKYGKAMEKMYADVRGE